MLVRIKVGDQSLIGMSIHAMMPFITVHADYSPYLRFPFDRHLLQMSFQPVELQTL
jgi:hypothetical protein